MASLCMTKEKGLSHLGSFLLGTLLPTILLLLLASDRLSERLSILSSFGNGQSPAQDQQQANNNLTLPNSRGSSAPAPDQEVQEEDRFPGLAQLLREVATEDRTVIITSVNEAWARPNSLLDLFRGSFRDGEGIAPLLNHTLIVALDPAGLRHCAAVHPHCFLLQVKGMNLSVAERFQTRGYLELVWAKLSIQQRILELGYNYLFTDVDVMWFRSPFRHISLYHDLTISCDSFFGDPESLGNAPNTGFYYVKASNRTVQMLRHWREARSRFPPNKHDQQVFGAIKSELAEQLGIRFHFVNTAFFGCFCSFPGELGAAVATMHANCCIGLENKMHDLSDVIADWKNYTSLLTPEDRKSGKTIKWARPNRCLRSIGRH